MKGSTVVLLGSLIGGASHAAETLTPSNMIDSFGRFANEVSRLEQDGEKQLQFLTKAYKTADADQKQEIDSEIGALQIELRDLEKKRQALLHQIDELKSNLPAAKDTP